MWKAARRTHWSMNPKRRANAVKRAQAGAARPARRDRRRDVWPLRSSFGEDGLATGHRLSFGGGSRKGCRRGSLDGRVRSKEVTRDCSGGGELNRALAAGNGGRDAGDQKRIGDGATSPILLCEIPLIATRRPVALRRSPTASLEGRARTAPPSSRESCASCVPHVALRHFAKM